MKKKKREQWVYYRWVNGNGAIWDQDNTELGTQRIEHMESELALTGFNTLIFTPLSSIELELIITLIACDLS